MSFVALDRITEERAKLDSQFRHRLASTGKPLLSQSRKLTEAELLGKLEAVGIRLDKSSYAEIAEPALSAEAICRTVVAQGHSPIPRFAEFISRFDAVISGE